MTFIGIRSRAFGNQSISGLPAEHAARASFRAARGSGRDRAADALYAIISI